MIRRLLAVLALTMAMVSAAGAETELGYRTYIKAGSYDDVKDDVKEAIVGRGFVVDYIGHINSMLERTADAAASVTATGAKSPYKNAEYLQFCPSKITHDSVSADPHGIANCPIAIFVYELIHQPGKIVVGYRLPVPSPSRRVKEINERLIGLLHEIATEATK